MSDCFLALSYALEADLASVQKHITPWSSLDEVNAARLQKALLSKYQGKSTADADAKALSKFLSVNENVGRWEPRWEQFEDELMGEVKLAVHQFWSGPAGLNPLVTTVSDLFEGGYSGPGASFGSHGKDFYTKFFSSPLCSTSSELSTWYSACVKKVPRWLSAEEFRASHFGTVTHVQGSKISFAPKKVDISRVICVEPSLNMFFQLGFKQILERRLIRCFGIDMSVQQDRSRELARLGSLDDGPTGFVTVDLESASDSISLKMLRWLLPPDFLRWLERLRCPRALLPSGEWVELNMVSTMGNGFTFPLQTMIFSCVVAGVCRYRGIPFLRSRGSHLGNFSVFGDDIVVTKQIIRDTLRVLKHLGFTVNTDKTFVEGPFRESCGRDFFKGHDVRPVFIKRLERQQDRYVAINSLLEWSAKTGINVSAMVRVLMPTVRYQPVPHWENIDAGIRVPSILLDKMRRCRRTGSIMYRRSVPRPSYLVFGVDSVLCRGRRRIYNPDGAMVAFLHGSVRNGRVTVRHDKPLYRAEWAVAPSWDNGPCGVGVAPTLWRRWDTAVYYAIKA